MASSRAELNTNQSRNKMTTTTQENVINTDERGNDTSIQQGENRKRVENEETKVSSEKQPRREETTNKDDRRTSTSSLKSDPILNELIGNNVPSIPLQVLKRNPRSENLSPPTPKWIWAPIDHPARKDGLKLKHWVRTDDQHEVYRFGKYDTTSNVFSYTTEEYYHLLRDDHWTKAETDYLFDLLNTYDLRFPVVHDRYEYAGSHERTLDDLKARYYSICQKLIPHRPPPNPTTAAHLDESNKKQLIQSYQFDKQKEVERKKHVKSLMNRTPAQLQEEEFIYIETRRLEQNLLRRIKNRDELMKVIGGFQHQILNEMKFWPIVEPSPTTLQLSRLAISNSISSNSNSASNPSGLTHSTQPDKRSARKDDVLDEAPIYAANGGVLGHGQEMNVDRPKAIDPREQIENDMIHCINRLDSQSLPGSTSGSAGHHRTVGLRSARITLPKTVAASTRLSTVMSELKIPSLMSYLPKPLIMPTRKNVESYERLIQATNQLVDLKRLVDRVDTDLKIHRKKKDALLATLSTSSGNHPSSATEDPPTGPTKTESLGHSPCPPQQHPQIESNPDHPLYPGLDSPKSTSNKKRSASVCSSSSSSSSATGSPNNPQQQHPKPGSQSSRKKIRKN